MVFKLNDNLRGAKTNKISRINVDDVNNRQLTAVYEYWSKVRSEKTAPSLREFKLEDLQPDIIPLVTIVDFSGPPFDYRYRFFGSKVVQAAGMELTGKSYYGDEIRGFGYENSQIFPTMIDERQPIVTRTIWSSVKSLQYHSTAIRMPLSADGTRITGGVTVYCFNRKAEQNLPKTEVSNQPMSGVSL